MLFYGSVCERKVGDDLFALQRGADGHHGFAVQSDEQIRQRRKQAGADGDEYDHGDDGFAHVVVIEDRIIRHARIGIRHQSEVFVDKREQDGGENGAYRGDHGLEILRKAFYAHAGFVLLCVKAAGHDGGLNDILRSVRKVEDEQRDDKKHKAAFEGKEHYGGGDAVCQAEGKTRFARAQLINEQGRQDHARREAYRYDGFRYALEAAVAQLVSADPGQQGDQRGFEAVEEPGDGDRPKLPVFGEDLHTVEEFDLVDVHFGDHGALLGIV